MNGEDRGGKRALVLFSGGKDSLLTTCELIELGFRVALVTFENGAGIAGNNARVTAERVIERYGGKLVEYLGVRSTVGIWREFLPQYYNMTPGQIASTYGQLPTSQFHCLTCRSSMYIWSIIWAKQEGCAFVADGARSVQGFVIELPGMAKRFQDFFREYSLELMFPVLDLTSDWELKNRLLRAGFVPKTIEPQCFLGVPLPNGEAPDKTVVDAVEKYFDEVVAPWARQFISTHRQATNIERLV